MRAAAGGCAFDFDLILDSFARGAGTIGRGRLDPVDVGA
jgi:hypothetical protein